jgi:uncharacterized membrane protein
MLQLLVESYIPIRGYGRERSGTLLTVYQALMEKKRRELLAARLQEEEDARREQEERERQERERIRLEEVSFFCAVIGSVSVMIVTVKVLVPIAVAGLHLFLRLWYTLTRGS